MAWRGRCGCGAMVRLQLRWAVTLLIALPATVSAKQDGVSSFLRQAASFGQFDATPSRTEFGPGGCVKLYNEDGGCFIRTQCAGKDLSKTEFRFVCSNPGSEPAEAMHSYGVGSFMEDEEFNTNVQCKKCSTVEFMLAEGGPLYKKTLTNVELTRTSAIGDEPSHAFYGPNLCLSSFRSQAGTCQIRSRCTNVKSFREFNVGVMCMDKAGEFTRYLFGAGQFDEEEEFDTHVQCEGCLGLNFEQPQSGMVVKLPKHLVDEVTSLKSEVNKLKTKLANLTKVGTKDDAAPTTAAPRSVVGRDIQKAGGAASKKWSTLAVGSAEPAGGVRGTRSLGKVLRLAAVNADVHARLLAGVDT